jgi:ABC-type uncharacterized transport system involved in gliding motility auxiliary subunit
MADSQEFRRKFFIGNFAFLGILVLILVAVYFLSDLLSAGKLDLTEDKLYTVSPGTKQILSGLTDKVHVKYHCTDPLPSILQNLRRDTQDLFEEFRDLSNGNFEYSIVNPEAAAAEFATQKVKEYYEAKKAGKTPEEPQPPQRIEDIFGGRKPPGGDQVREAREKTAATIAAQGGEDKAAVERRLLTQDWERNYYQKLEQEGIGSVPIEVRDASSVRLVKIYSAIEIKYLDKEPEVLPFYTTLESLEYELASRILKLTASEKPVVAFFDGRKPPAPPPNPMNPVRPPPSEYQLTINALGQLFDLRQIDLKEGNSIDDLVVRLKEDRRRKAEEESGEEPKKDDAAKEEDKKVKPEDVKAFIKCLVVAQPDQLESRQVYELSRAVSLGVPAVFLVSRYTMDISQEGVQNGLPLTMLHTGLDDLFRKWGIELGGELLASNQCATVNIPTPIGQGLVMMSPRQLPVSVETAGPAIDQSSPLTNKIPSLAFPATCGFKVLEETIQKAGLKSEVLARTVKESWSVKVDPFERLQNPLRKHQGIGTSVAEHQEDLARRKDPSEFRDFVEPTALAVRLEGKFPFAFEGETVPAWKKEDKDAPKPPPGFPGGLPGGLPEGFDDGDHDLALNLADPQDAKADAGSGAAPAAGGETPPAGGQPPPPDAKAPETAPPPPAAPVPSAAPAPAPAEPTVTAPAQPAGTPAPQAGAETAKPAEAAPPPEKASVTPVDGKVLLLASADMIKNEYLQQSREYEVGFRLMQNAIENFGLSDILSNIRRKQLTARQFKPESEKISSWIIAINIAIVPVVVGLLGLVYYGLRRKASVDYERRFIQKAGA